MPDSKVQFKVVIVGGSIAGLTLAHCLQKAEIDFVVLESRDEIAPQVGASIGILPNGARILDQLGVYKDIEKLIEPLIYADTWTGKGELLTNGDQTALIAARFGYPIAFLDRQLVLKTLADHIRDSSKILLGKRVLEVDHTATGVIVHCKDGSEHHGDIVVGADGVHSTVRHEMWRHADLRGLSSQFEKDRLSLSSEYKCMFGISTPVEGLLPGSSHRSFNADWSFLILGGKAGRVFWFATEKMDKRYFVPNIPRFSKEDGEDYIQHFLDRYVAKGIPFSKIWENRVTHTLVALEEAKYEHWVLDRFACVGDSIHKMTPNMGQGGNSAIESAAALTNALVDMKKRSSGQKANFSLTEVKQAVQAYEDSRKQRADKICDAANELTRLEAVATPKHYIISKYLIPIVGDLLADRMTATMVGANRLNIAPLPDGRDGNLAFEDTLSPIHPDSTLIRIAKALPLLGLSVAGFVALKPTLGAMKAFGSEARLIPQIGFTFPIGFVDKLFRRYVFAFTPSIGDFDPISRLQMLGFMNDLAPVHMIWIIESLRRGNLLTGASISTLFACVYQLHGIGILAPLYYFLHYVTCPQERYLAADNRMVPIADAKVLLPNVALGYVVPTVGMFFASSLDARQKINAVWQFFPIWTVVLQRALKPLVKDTTRDDRKWDTEADMPYLRAAYLSTGVFAGLTYTYLRFASPISVKQVMLGEIFSSNIGTGFLDLKVTGFLQGLRKFLRFDHTISMTAGLGWQGLHLWELKKNNKITAKEAFGAMGAVAAISAVFGPGAGMAAGWWWREEKMAAYGKRCRGKQEKQGSLKNGKVA